MLQSSCNDEGLVSICDEVDALGTKDVFVLLKKFNININTTLTVYEKYVALETASFYTIPTPFSFQSLIPKAATFASSYVPG